MIKIVAFFLLTLGLLLTSCSDQENKEGYKPAGKKTELNIYTFGIHPYLNTKKMYSSYMPILDLIEKRLGNVRFRLETSKTYADYEKKLYRGDFDFSLPNPYQTLNALSHGYTVVAKMKPDTVFKGIFIARKDQHITSFEQIKGKVVSFPAPTALAATMMPLYYLHQHGIDTGKDITKKFVGSQYSSILNAYSLDSTIAATWPPPWESWKKENPKKAEKMELIWQTEPLINNGVIVKKELDQELVKKVVDILVELENSDEGRKMLENAGFEGFERAQKRDYDRVAEFLDRYNNTVGAKK